MPQEKMLYKIEPRNLTLRNPWSLTHFNNEETISKKTSNHSKGWIVKVLDFLLKKNPSCETDSKALEIF